MRSNLIRCGCKLLFVCSLMSIPRVTDARINITDFQKAYAGSDTEAASRRYFNDPASFRAELEAMADRRPGVFFPATRPTQNSAIDDVVETEGDLYKIVYRNADNIDLAPVRRTLADSGVEGSFRFEAALVL